MLHGPIRRGGLATCNPGGCFEDPATFFGDSSSKVCLEDIEVSTVNSNISRRKTPVCITKQNQWLSVKSYISFSVLALLTPHKALIDLSDL